MTATRTNPSLRYPDCVPEDSFISRGADNDPRKRWITDDGVEHKNLADARYWVATKIMQKSNASKSFYSNPIHYTPGTWAKPKVQVSEAKPKPMKTTKKNISTATEQFQFSHTDRNGNTISYSASTEDYMRQFLKKQYGF